MNVDALPNLLCSLAHVRIEKKVAAMRCFSRCPKAFTQLLLLLSLLVWCDAYGGATGEATSGRDRALVAEINQRPLIFFVAKGGPDACGPGCSKWIAADGMIDSGALERFRTFLEEPERRSLPVFFNSPGGIASQSIAIGLMLRKYRMTAGVGRTLPNGCRATMPDECRRIARSKPEQESRLVTLGARCASGCVYALLGAPARQVARYAQLGIHSPRYVEALKGSEAAPHFGADVVDDELRGYLTEMGNDPGLVDFAASVTPDRIHWMTREEIERYHIETHGDYETPWTAHQAGGGRFAISKSLRQSLTDGSGYYTTVIRLACLNSFTYVVSYRSELPVETGDSTPVRLAAAGNVIQLAQLPARPDGVAWYGSVAREAMRRAATEPKIKVSEVIGPNQSRDFDLSTAGLSAALDRLQQYCNNNWGPMPRD
jgi:hypothetical protein